MISNPIIISFLILAAILVVPLLCEKIHIPSIVGLILTGLLVGPYGLGLVARNETIDAMGSLGMLYLMFVSGIEIDMDEFRSERHKSIWFGLLTFSVPFVLSLLVCRYAMNFSWPSAVLFASMLASHTLMTYPVVSRYGVQKNKAVSIVIGATVLAVTGSMLILTAVSSAFHDTFSGLLWLRIGLGSLLMLIIIFVGYPRLTAWFFRKFNDSIVEFTFVLTLAALGGVMARVAGIEPILGVFLAGLALNRQIPNLSPLMNKITFVGNAIFIPVFLLSVGMLINLEVFARSINPWGVAGIMSIVAVLGKWLAAWLAQRSLHLTKNQRQLIFGLTNSHAAGALATVMIGYNLFLPDGNRIFGEDVLNAVVLLILVSCAISSFITEHAAKHIALEEMPPQSDSEEGAQRILMAVANPQSNDQLIELGTLLLNKDRDSSLHALAVVRRPEEKASAERMLEQTAKTCAANDYAIELHRQVAVNISNGIRTMAQEEHVTHILVGSARESEEYGYGKAVNPLLTTLGQSIWITHLQRRLLDFHSVRVIVPEHAEAEPDYLGCKRDIIRLCTCLQAERTFEPITDWTILPRIADSLADDELLIVMQARRSTASYVPGMDKTSAVLKQRFSGANYIVVFPQQDVVAEADNTFLSEFTRHTESTFSFFERMAHKHKK